MSLGEAVGSKSRRRSRRASEPVRSSSKSMLNTTTSLTGSSVETLDSSCFQSSSDDIDLNHSDISGHMSDICSQSRPGSMCLECDSCICGQCSKVHPVQYGHRGSVEITDRSGILTVHQDKMQSSNVCMCKTREPTDIHCSKHVTFCCRQCETKHHSDCSTISVEKLLIETDIPKLKSATSNLLKENLSKFLSYIHQNNKEKLRKHRDALLRHAKTYTKELIHLIKSKLDLFTNELERVFNDNLTLLEQCERNIQNLQLDIQAVEQPKPLSEYEDRLAQLKVLKTVETRKLQNYKTFGEQLMESERFLEVEFNRNESLHDLLKEASIGQLCKVNDDRSSFSNRPVKGEIKYYDSTRSKSKHKVNIETMSYENCNFMSCWTEGDYGSDTCITDIKTMANNTLLIADNENQKLKLLRQISQGLEVISSLDLGGEPWQISEIDSNKFVVTVLQSSSPICMFIDVVGTRIAPGKSFGLKKECTGIAVTGNDVILCGYDGEHAYIITTDFAGTPRGEINFYGKSGLKRPNYLCLSSDKLVLCVSDADRGVFGLDINDLNKVVFHVKEDIKCPLGMTLDRHGNLIVCGSQSHAIYILSKGGKLKRKIKVGYMQIQSVAVLDDSSFILSSGKLGYDLAVVQNCD